MATSENYEFAFLRLMCYFKTKSYLNLILHFFGESFKGGIILVQILLLVSEQKNHTFLLIKKLVCF